MKKAKRGLYISSMQSSVLMCTVISKKISLTLIALGNHPYNVRLQPIRTSFEGYYLLSPCLRGAKKLEEKRKTNVVWFARLFPALSAALRSSKNYILRFLPLAPILNNYRCTIGHDPGFLKELVCS